MEREVVLYALWCLISWLFLRAINRHAKEIASLKSETLILAKSVKSHGERFEKERKESTELWQEDQKQFKDLTGRVEALEKPLTTSPPKPKIVAKQRVNWKNFRSAAEKASELESEEA